MLSTNGTAMDIVVDSASVGPANVGLHDDRVLLVWLVRLNRSPKKPRAKRKVHTLFALFVDQNLALFIGL
jgi:hypothetical protein